MKEEKTDKEKLEEVKNIIASLEIPKGSISDGSHTFDELYEHRNILWIALCRTDNELAYEGAGVAGATWRTKLHSDGSSFDNWFILGMHKKAGMQITYHLPMKYWDDCAFAVTLLKAPEWDKHTSKDVLNRISELNKNL